MARALYTQLLLPLKLNNCSFVCVAAAAAALNWEQVWCGSMDVFGAPPHHYRWQKKLKNEATNDDWLLSLSPPPLLLQPNRLDKRDLHMFVGLLDVVHWFMINIQRWFGRMCHLGRLLWEIRMSLDRGSADHLRVDIRRVRQSSAVLLVLGRPLHGARRLMLGDSHATSLHCGPDYKVGRGYQ